MTTHRVPCARCSGQGTVPRVFLRGLSETDYVRRSVVDMPGADRELCDRCGGSGDQPLDPASVTERVK